MGDLTPRLHTRFLIFMMGISRFQGKVVKQSIFPLKQVIRLLHEQRKRMSSHGLARTCFKNFLVWDGLQMLLVYFTVFQSSVNCTVTRSLDSKHLVTRNQQILPYYAESSACFEAVLLLFYTIPSANMSRIHKYFCHI